MAKTIANPIEVDTRTAAQRIADQISSALINEANARVVRYNQIKAMYYNNPAATAQQIFACFSQEDAEAILELRSIEKACINRIKQGTIVDDVPAATITLPDNLFG